MNAGLSSPPAQAGIRVLLVLVLVVFCFTAFGGEALAARGPLGVTVWKQWEGVVMTPAVPSNVPEKPVEAFCSIYEQKEEVCRSAKSCGFTFWGPYGDMHWEAENVVCDLSKPCGDGYGFFSDYTWWTCSLRPLQLLYPLAFK